MTPDRVILTITQLDTPEAALPAGVLRVIDTDVDGLVEAASACVREYVLGDRCDRLLGGVGRTFAVVDPPPSGFVALINKPTGLLFLATWPWGHPERLLQQLGITT